MYTRCWRAETSLFLLLCRGLVCEKKRKEKRNCSDWFGRTMERERETSTRGRVDFLSLKKQVVLYVCVWRRCLMIVSHTLNSVSITEKRYVVSGLVLCVHPTLPYLTLSSRFTGIVTMELCVFLWMGGPFALTRGLEGSELIFLANWIIMTSYTHTPGQWPACVWQWYTKV